MTNEQQRKFEELREHFATRCTITPDVVAMLETLARVDVEERELQAFCDENGTTYVATNGVSRQRPEWQQLKENRQRKASILATLLRAFPVPGQSAGLTEIEEKFFA